MKIYYVHQYCDNAHLKTITPAQKAYYLINSLIFIYRID